MRKRLLLIATVLLAVPVLAVLIAAIALPSERVAALAASRAEAMLGREVRIGDVGLRLLPIGVSLSDLRVAGATADAPPFATLDGALLRVRLWPLLRGRVAIDEIELRGARIAVAFDSAGVLDLPRLVSEASDDGGAGDGGSASAPDAAARDIAFDIRRLRIEDAGIALDDARTGRAVRVDGYSQTLGIRGELSGGRLAHIALTGRVDIDSIAARMPGDSSWTFRGLRIALNHDARFLADSARLALDGLRLEVQGIAVRGSGTVDGIGGDGPPVLDLRLEAEELELGALLALVPPSLRAALDDAPELGGRVALESTVHGPLGLEALPAVDGVLRMREVSASLRGSALLSGLTGDITFSNDSAASTGLTGRLLGEPMRLAFAATDPVDPALRFDLAARLSLDAATAAGLVPDTLPAVGGVVAVDLDGSVRRSTPDEARIDGTVALESFTMAAHHDRPEVVIARALFAIEANALRADAFTVRVAGQPITVAFSATDWLPLALGDSTALPSAALDVRAVRLDLDRFAGEAPPPVPPYSQLLFARMAGTPIDGRSAGDIARERGMALPELPQLNARVSASIDTLVKGAVVYTDVDVALDLTPERLEVTHARLELMGGSVDARATLTPLVTPDGSPGRMRAQAQGSLTGVEAGPFLARFTLLRDRMSGRLDLSGSADLVLDSLSLPEAESVDGRGDLRIHDGRMASWPMLRAVAERVGLAGWDTLRLSEFAGGVSVRGATVRMDDARLDSDDVDATVAGSFGFDGTLDFGVDARFPATLAARGGPAFRGAAASMADSDGQVPVGLRVGGTWRRPEVAPDFSQAAGRVVDRAREAGRREAETIAREAGDVVRDAGAAARDAAADAAGGLTDRLLGRGDSVTADSQAARLPSLDSVGTALDSVRDAAEDRVRGRLRDLF